MNKSIPNSIVVEAKHQYTIQLIDTLSPFIYQGFKNLFMSCKNSPGALKKFQEKLCNVTKWNQDIIDNEYDRIVRTSKCEWIDKLIEVIFICNVKILTTISDGKKTFNIKIPEIKNFIHKCYIETARNLYIDPRIIDDSVDNNNLKKCLDVISKSIEKTIYNLIPQQEIIEKCLSNDEMETSVPDTQDDIKEEYTNYSSEDSEHSAVESESESESQSETEENEEYNSDSEEKPVEESSNEQITSIEDVSNKIFMREPEPILDVYTDDTPDPVDPVKDDGIPFFSDDE